MATVGHIYSGLPNKLFSIIVYYFFISNKFILLNLQYKFSKFSMVQYGSLLQVSSHFATESCCISDVFASNQCCPAFLFSTAFLLKNSWNQIMVPCVSVSSVLPSLAQMCASISCPRKMSLLLPEAFIQLCTWYWETTKKDFRLDGSWKWTANIPSIVDWANFFR